MAKTTRTAAIAMPALAPEESPFEPVGPELPEGVPVGGGILDIFEMLDVCDCDDDVLVERTRWKLAKSA